MSAATLTRPGAVTTALAWHDARAELPDSDTTVLLWTLDPDADDGADWAAGWHDGECWRLCESGGVCGQIVTHWAEPQGPTE